MDGNIMDSGGTVRQGDVLWRPTPDARANCRLGVFLDRLQEKTGCALPDYASAWRWSIEHLESFWAAVWEHFDIESSTPYSCVLESRRMPGAVWFPDAGINYAFEVLKRLGDAPDKIVLHAFSQTRGELRVDAAQLRALVGRIQDGLRRQGVGKGDVVAAYLPNLPETLAAYLAAAGLGAVWCSVAPEMGQRSLLDRIGQLAPRVLLAVDGYRWGDRTVCRREDLDCVSRALPETRIVRFDYLGPGGDGAFMDWNEFIAIEAEPTTCALPFSHPLAVLFTSGTSGRPKPIVHSHGGLLIEHLKSLALQMDLGPGDTAFWFTSTGWMVWNLQASTLLVGAAVVLLDGDPGWPSPEGEWSQWAIAARAQATFLGTSAAYLAACARAGMRPGARWNLAALREIVSSGSPLSASAAAWVYDAVGRGLLLAPTSGGTDVCSAFVGGSPLTPAYAGEMSCPPLGVAVAALDAQGREVVDAPGELVVSLPMPSMPVGFWGDVDGERYRAAYFDEYPGRWRHGDWLIHTGRDTWNITGRSDATLNRGGVRLGTAEYYSLMDGFDGIADSLVLHLEDGDGMGTLLLAVVLRHGKAEQDLFQRLRTAIREELSPRHVPDLVIAVPSIPRNRTGKRLEVPLKRLLNGAAMEEVLDTGVMDNPDDLLLTVDRIRAAVLAH
jgi:acetoacetyl-CoA synthetase